MASFWRQQRPKSAMFLATLFDTEQVLQLQYSSVAETRSIYVKHDAVARTGHLFSAETSSFSVETRAFSVDEHFPCELKKARPPEYLLSYTTGGGRENKVTSQHRGQNITSQFYKYECFNMGTDIQHINCENCQVEILFVYSFCNNCGNRLDTGKYTYYKVLLFLYLCYHFYLWIYIFIN